MGYQFSQKKNEIINVPKMVRIALGFILINALMWFVIGVLIALNVHPGMPDDALLRWMMMLGMFGGAIILGLLYLLLSKRRRLAFFITLVVLAVIILLTVTDQMGWADYVELVLAVVPLILLFLERNWFRVRDRVDTR
jgi:lysylphosphatidylglycerol synthetase-like protein (DUF2156 family)